MEKFYGPDYDPEMDYTRLKRKIDRIRALMLDGKWRTHSEVAKILGVTTSCVSSQLRNLRCPEHGGFIVKRRPRDRKKGLFEYRMFRPKLNKKYYRLAVKRRTEILEEAEGRFLKAKKELRMAVKKLQKFETRAE